MQIQDSAAPPRSGLMTALDIIIAPNAAFATLRQSSTWFWAFLISSILGIAAALILIPAFTHAMDASLPAQLAANPSIAKLPADQQQTAIANATSVSKLIVKLYWIIIPFGLLLSGLVQALILLIANAISQGDGTFKKFFALAMNVTIVGGALSSVVLVIVVLLRGSDSFASAADITNAIPGLGMLVPSSAKVLSAFLGTFSVFNLWAVALLALGAQAVGNVKRPAAIGAALFILIMPALFAAYGASR